MSFSPSHLDDIDDLDNLSEKELKFGYWFTAHRVKIYQGLLVALIVFDVLLGGYNLFRWGEYVAVGFWADQRLRQEIARPLINYSLLKEHFSAKPMSVTANYFFPGVTKADAAAMVKNPNVDFLVEFDYRFLVNNAPTPWRKGFLLPGEGKPIVEFGIDSGALANGATLDLQNLAWQRISNHQVKDLAGFMAERLNFKTDEMSAEGGVLSFNIVNQSNFNYYQPRFMILLDSNGNVSGVEQAVFGEFLAGEKKSVTMFLLGSHSAITSVSVRPDINIFDAKAYIR